MSELVERVARAICKSRTCEGISCCQWPAQGGRTDCPVKRGAYDAAAQDAIEAMPRDADALQANREFVGWVDSWVSNPIGAYSVMALDGLFIMARDKIAKLPQASEPK